MTTLHKTLSYFAVVDTLDGCIPGTLQSTDRAAMSAYLQRMEVTITNQVPTVFVRKLFRLFSELYGVRLARVEVRILDTLSMDAAS